MKRNLIGAIVLFSFVANGAAQDGSSSGAPVGGAADGGSVVGLTTIYTNLAGHPTAAVPGMPGVEFKASTTSSTQFDRPFGAPGGSIAIIALTSLATTMDEVVLFNGAVVAQEGTTTPFDPTVTYGLFDTRLGVNATEVVFAVDLSGATTADEVLVRAGAGPATLIAREGTAMPALAGANYGSIIESPSLLGNGTVGFVADGFTGTGVTTATNEALILGTTILNRAGIDTPANQLVAPSQLMENMTANAVWFSDDGSHWLVMGDMAGATATDQVLVRDNVVLIQEGAVLPGSGYLSLVAATGINGQNMDSAGGWMARGSNVDGQDWVVRNGRIVAQGGSPITPGTTEAWGGDTTFADTFFLHIANAAGHYVIGGVTNAAATANGVLVLNGNEVIVRESDPIDLNGNGMFDDNAFFRTFGDDDGYLTDSGAFYFVATIKDAAGAQTGQGFFRIDLNLAGLQACGAGTAPAELLTINGFTGGGARRATVPQNFPLTVSLATAPGNDFILFMYVGVPGAPEVFDLFGLGNMCFAPCLVPPISAQPVFTLSDSLAGFWCPSIFPGQSTISLPGGIPLTVQLTMQAVVIAPPQILISNAIHLDVP